jgi:hypothetical protein
MNTQADLISTLQAMACGLTTKQEVLQTCLEMMFPTP